MNKLLKYLLLGLAILFIILIIVSTVLNGTGFFGYYGENKEYHPGRTLWDWMQLLLVPIVLAIVALIFNNAERQREREIELDRMRENAYQSFLDNMEKLILAGLKNSKRDDDIRELARSRTLATLRSLDGKRKGLLLHFLYESGLILESKTGEDDHPIISLRSADLSETDVSANTRTITLTDWSSIKAVPVSFFNRANLSGVDLHKANLSNAYLAGTNLSGANLKGANLQGAVLSEASLSGANLYGADLSDAHLEKTCLEKCDLQKVNFTETNLDSAKFLSFNASSFGDQGPFRDRSPLTGAILVKTNLINATILPDQLKDVKSLQEVILPNGSNYDGPCSLFTINVKSLPPANDEGMHKAGWYFGRYETDLFCHCGQQFKNTDPMEPIVGLWYGLIHHRIKTHGYKATLADGNRYNELFSDS